MSGRLVEQVVDVPVRQIEKQFESVKMIPQERLRERVVATCGLEPVPPILNNSVDLVCLTSGTCSTTE